jgi:antirestriction protein
MIDDMAVYIANLGKYNEGYLVGAWFTFPIDEEDVKEKIGLNEQYEEYAIHDTDNFPIAIGEYVSIEELNEMYEMIEELPDYIVECLDEFISHYGTLEEVVEHKDDIYYYPDCETMTVSDSSLHSPVRVKFMRCRLPQKAPYEVCRSSQRNW